MLRLGRRFATPLTRWRTKVCCGVRREKVSLSREATSNGIRKYRGDHEWPYRDKAIRYAFQFFRNMDMKTTPIISKSRLLTGKDRM